ncbi:disks large-associated protein 1-like [Linepithema humile]|uniref:disks large-associated protein 1-like n=1 Tax=Linepithema humile TaxID=83485 RepID=UPI0006237A5C|nr:PREDICTED: disks large-associated protein 1-like [Linepithema humile]
MSDFIKQYKKPPSTFGKTTIIKSKLVQKQQEERVNSRTEILEKNRKKKYLLTSQNNNNLQKLMEWKAERARKKKAEELTEKPPFKVGIVHHKYFSPPNFLTNDLVASKKKKVARTDNKTTFKRRITKATEKRLKAKAAKQEARKQEAWTQETRKQEAPTTSSHNTINGTLYTSGEKSNNNKIESIERELFDPPDHKFNSSADLSTILFGNVFIENTSIEDILSHDKSVEKVFSTILSSDEDEPLNFSQNEQVEKKEHSTKYFKRLLCKEKDRLQKLCDKWTAIQSQDNITEDIQYQINQAVGQTTMLIKEKFEQFRHLILICEKSEEKKDDIAGIKITCTDLHGFWDMMYIQVKDCDSRFAKLEKLRAGNWQEQLLHMEFLSARKKTTKTPKQSSSRTSILGNQKKKKLAKIGDAKKHSLPIKTNDIFTTPSMRNKKTAFHKNLDILCRRKLLYHTIPNCTSTPFSESIMSSTSNRISTSFITIKVSKFYQTKFRSSDTSTPQLNNEKHM